MPSWPSAQGSSLRSDSIKTEKALIVICFVLFFIIQLFYSFILSIVYKHSDSIVTGIQYIRRHLVTTHS